MSEVLYPQEEDYAVPMSLGGLQAIRHIVLTEPERLFQFRLGAETQQAVNQFSETFVRYQLDYQPQTLQFYKRLLSTQPPFPVRPQQRTDDKLFSKNKEAL